MTTVWPICFLYITEVSSNF